MSTLVPEAHMGRPAGRQRQQHTGVATAETHRAQGAQRRVNTGAIPRLTTVQLLEAQQSLLPSAATVTSGYARQCPVSYKI